ncbi:MAG: class I SAM-dependent methyltransferase [Rhodospirillales bacterium]|nr:class I SAM-dependent methyltransferase [Rhodospirillales bacterium]
MSIYSRTDHSPRYRALLDLNRQLHSDGDALHGIPAAETFDGRSLKPHVSIIKGLIGRFGAKTLLDYGAGKGDGYSKASARLPDGRVLTGLKDVWGLDSVTLYDPCYLPHARLPDATFDAVICTDVLEHCPEEDMPWILGEIFSYARQFVFVTIALYPAVKSLPTGENAHITLKSVGWWADQLEAALAGRAGLRYFAAIAPQNLGRKVLIEG